MTTFWFRKLPLLLAQLSITGLSLSAQEKKYTLSELVDTAKIHFPQLLRKNAQLDFAKAAVTDTKHQFLPVLKTTAELTAGTDNSLAGSYFTFGMIPSTSAGVRAQNNTQLATGNIAALNAQYDLATFGYRQALVHRAGSYVYLQQADAQQELYFLQSAIARWYFTLLKNQYKLKADAENIARYENIFRVIKALAGSGIRAGADSSLAMAELSRTKITYNQTQGLVDNCRANLSYFTGIAADNISIDSAAMKELKIKSGLFNRAPNSFTNPLLEYYRQLKNIAVANEQLISKSFLPKIVLTATSWARGSSIAFNDQYKSAAYGLGYQRLNYLAGVSFQYDLFNGIHKRDRLNAYRFETAASDLALRGQEQDLINASLQADNAIRSTEKNLLELPVQLAAARDTYNQKIAQYKAGIINVVDLTNAAYVLYRSMNDYAETIGDWYLAQLDKAVATGYLDNFIQAIK